MTKLDKAALRTARQQRLAGRADVGGAASQSKQADTVKETVSVESHVSDALTAAVLDPRNISKSAAISLQLFNEHTSDPHWLVCADGQPVAQIRLSDQDDADHIAKVFTTEAYANGIVSAAARMDLEEILAGVKARSYVATVRNSDAYQEIVSTLKNEAATELRKAKANLRNDMINTLNLVVKAQTKNFIVENSLKDALHNRMTASGIESDRAIAIIEAAWQEKSSEYFEACFRQAMKWGDLTAEAYNELQEQINDMPQRTPIVEVAASVPSSKNIPIATYASYEAEEHVSEREQMRNRLGFRSRYNANKTSR